MNFVFCFVLFFNILEDSSTSEQKNKTKETDLSKMQLQNLANQLTNSSFQFNGKSTSKEEFVTAGGIDLKEINFKPLESKLNENLYFAGEILNIDAVLGDLTFKIHG